MFLLWFAVSILPEPYYACIINMKKLEMMLMLLFYFLLHQSLTTTFWNLYLLMLRFKYKTFSSQTFWMFIGLKGLSPALLWCAAFPSCDVTTLARDASWRAESQTFQAFTAIIRCMPVQGEAFFCLSVYRGGRGLNSYLCADDEGVYGNESVCDFLITDDVL